MTDARYELFKDDAGEWRWRLLAANSEIVATGESYTTKEDAERGVMAAARASAQASSFEIKGGGEFRLEVSDA